MGVNTTCCTMGVNVHGCEYSSHRCEYDVLHSLVANSSAAADVTADGSDDLPGQIDDLPDQIAVGVHYTWTHRPKARESSTL